MPVVGSRFLIEAGFIIAVAVIAGIERLGTWWIIAVVASAWIIVAIVEIVVWARQVAVHQPHTVEPSEPLAEAPPFVATPPVSPPVAKAEEKAAEKSEPESSGEEEAQAEGPAPTDESQNDQQP